MKNKSVLNKQKVKIMHRIAKDGRGDHYFNCLSAVLFALDLADQLDWSWDEDIDFLIQKTKIIDETSFYRVENILLAEFPSPKVGDVLCVYSEDDEPMHFAVYTGRHGWFNKRGGLNSEYNNIYGILEDYDGCDDMLISRVEIRRLLEGA